MRKKMFVAFVHTNTEIKIPLDTVCGQSAKGV